MVFTRWWFSRIGLTLATLSIISNSPKFTWNWKLRSILLLYCYTFFWNKALWLHLFDIFPWSCSRTDVLQNFLKIDRWQYAIYGMAINKCIIMRAIRSGKSFVSALYRRKVYGPENSAQISYIIVRFDTIRIGFICSCAIFDQTAGQNRRVDTC